MKYRRLGRTGLQVSVIGVGTWQFGGEWGKVFTQAEVDAILNRARDLGINLIDTAECYGDHLSERLIGHSIAHERDRWIIATKFGHRFKHNFDRDQAYAPEEVAGQLEASLRALGTDYIDIYQLHSSPNHAFDQPELWAMLNEQVRAGKIRHLGLSISPNTNIYQTKRATAVGARTVQVIYNRLDRAAEQEVLPSCQAQELGVLARVPLASGLLTGKYRPGAAFTDPNDIRSQRDPEDTERQLREVERIRRHEVPKGVAMAAWALAWCLRNRAISAVIPGSKSPEQVVSNAAAADLVDERI